MFESHFMMKSKSLTLTLTPVLRDALLEIAPNQPWQDIALAFINGSVAEFWLNASTGSGLTMERYRERTRAFMREGDSLVTACRKAREPAV